MLQRLHAVAWIGKKKETLFERPKKKRKNIADTGWNVIIEITHYPVETHLFADIGHKPSVFILFVCLFVYLLFCFFFVFFCLFFIFIYLFIFCTALYEKYPVECKDYNLAWRNENYAKNECSTLCSRFLCVCVCVCVCVSGL